VLGPIAATASDFCIGASFSSKMRLSLGSGHDGFAANREFEAIA